ncbi:MAG: hypothetical protein JNL32_10935 [Candidatus Kapabacteria bacterium]|nr:hypothetical protein [Candidatus Kapabacteria bacterium]
MARQTICTLLTLGLFLLCGMLTHAQSSLTILNALAPYNLNPTLLSNGHFSITTNYFPAGTKGIIYQEDGQSGRPVNYTSHFHLRIDNTVYQLEYEADTATRLAPPPNVIRIQRLFRDTVNGTPRINARSFAIVQGDSMHILFSMFPVKRQSGAFIQMTIQVQNSTSQDRRVGALMLIDTKIGDNDRAPIATSFGYSGQETGFAAGTGNGLPDFWLAMEGTPITPGLVARGNLRDEGLITPDRLIFGNWTDYTSQGIRGLASVMWNERNASGLDYTDSAILLLWNETLVQRGSTVVKASTEIGIADSLSVSFGGTSIGGGGTYGRGGIGIAGAGTCISVSAQDEIPCGFAGWSAYLPDTLEAMYLVTNLDSVANKNNVRVVVPSFPAGLRTGTATGNVIPSSLIPSQTGVSVLKIIPLPRLQPQSYNVPVAVVINAQDTIVRDTLEVCVPGLQGTLESRDRSYPPVCPQTADTLYERHSLLEYHRRGIMGCKSFRPSSISDC